MIAGKGGRMRLKDKVAIVTGAGSGFGAGIAKRFAQEGAKVVVNDINAEGGARVAREVGGEYVQADVTKGADWARLVAAATAKFGKLDVVVNNAGWTHRRKPYLEVTEAEFDKVYAVNVKSIYLSALHAVPVFRRQGGGCFVNIASTAGLRPRPGLTVYNSSKGAVILMSRSMAAEFGPDKIRVNCVNPVFSPETALSADFAGGAVTEEAKKAFLATIPLGRFSTPLDVANACLYLASDEANFISGVCIEVDGARSV
jgi:3-oxoacyl-[acyl-carrier protein] reductase